MSENEFMEEMTPEEFLEEGKVTEEIEKLEEILGSIEKLETLFINKIQVDQHKNQLFDKLHEELKGYQDDIVWNMVNPIILEVIGVLERVKKEYERIPKEPTKENYERLIRKYGEVQEELEDILYSQDVEEYTIDGNIPDPKRQKIVKTTPTQKKELDNTVEKKLSAGFIRKNRIIKVERISLFKYQEEKNE